jgi:hypothetical protein
MAAGVTDRLWESSRPGDGMGNLRAEGGNSGSMTFAEIRPYQEKSVIFKLKDGEITTAKIALVDAEHEDIVVDIISTNRPENYRHAGSAYTIAIADLVSVQEVSRENSK